MLKIKNLSKHFGGVNAVSDCSFEVKKGKVTALIGPNGSGKTTLFNLISGIEKPDKGKIVFEGLNITNNSIEDISNSGISRVFQHSRLFKNLTVKDNLLTALDNKDTKLWSNILGKNKTTNDKVVMVRATLKNFGILETENQLAGELSFGQKRLVELARTVLNPHTLLMLDEPIAGVTPKIRKNIFKLLQDLKKLGETILIIEHDMLFTLELADDIIVLDAGKVIATGSSKEIKKNKLVLEAYLGN